MVGFSIPVDGTVLIVGPVGLDRLHLGPPITVETDLAPRVEHRVAAGDWTCRHAGRDWQLVGLQGGQPLLTSSAGEWLELDEDNRVVSVFVGTDPVWSSGFDNSSGDWAAATFSPDGTFIVLGCPYGFDFRVWHRSDAPRSGPPPGVD